MSARVADVFASHWPVFALLAGVMAVVVAAAVQGRGHAGDEKAPPREITGWTTVLVLPPVLYVAARANGSLYPG